METYERDHIGNNIIFNRIDTQEFRFGDYNEYTNTELENDTVHGTEEAKNKTNKMLTTLIEEC